VTEDMMRRENESESPPMKRERSRHRALAIGMSESSVCSSGGGNEAVMGLKRDVDAIEGE
jgi:hypothetical protein